jgi:hypothetical protein
MGHEKPVTTASHITNEEIMLRQSPTAELRESDPGTVPTLTTSMALALLRMQVLEYPSAVFFFFSSTRDGLGRCAVAGTGSQACGSKKFSGIGDTVGGVVTKRWACLLLTMSTAISDTSSSS